MNPQKLFRNYFDEITITTPRLVAFGVDHLNRMTQANDGTGPYTAMIGELTALLGELGVELIGVEGRMRVRKGLTQTTAEVMASLKIYMKDHEDELRYKLRDIPGAIRLFYPQDNRRMYYHLAKERMPVITSALSAAATTHAAALGTPLSTELRAFATQWKAASDAQEQAMGSLSEGRSNRNALRPRLNILLMRHIYRIADLFGEDPEGAAAFFNFPLLWPKGRREVRSRDSGRDAL